MLKNQIYRNNVTLTNSANNTVGAPTGTTFAGPCTGGCNLISGNTRDGVRLSGATASGNRLDYNYIGLNAAGTAARRNGVTAINLINAPNNIIGKPIDEPRISDGGSQIPTEILTVQNDEVCVQIDTDTNSHTVTFKRGGLQLSGTGEFTSFSPRRYVSSDGSVRFYRNDFNGVTNASVHLPLSPMYSVGGFIDDPQNCTQSTVGEQHAVGALNDLTFPGRDNTVVNGNRFNISPDGQNNIAQPGEDAVFFRFSNNVVTANNIFALVGQAANGAVFETGVGNFFSEITVIWQAQTSFNAISDPTLLDLDNNNRRNSPGTGTANNGLSHPVNFTSRISGEYINVRGTVTNGPPNSRLIVTFYEQDHYRGPDGTDQVRTYPIGVHTVVNTDAQGAGVFDFTMPNTRFIGADRIVATASVPESQSNATVPGGTVTGDTSEFSVPVKVPKGIFDFNGDGRTDFAVVRPGAGNGESYWYFLNSGDGSHRVERFGLGQDQPVAGDYQGDGVTDLAVWRPSDSAFYHSKINGSPTMNFLSIRWGLPGDIPVIGDFDDDGANDAAIFRPSDGIWYTRRSLGGSLFAQQWGLATDKLVPADYDGDGKTDIAVYSNGTWYISVCSVCPVRYERFGLADDVPVPADYDGDGIGDIAVWRPSEGIWYIQQSTAGFRAVKWGLATDKVLNGDFDADGKNDLAVWRPSEGNWYILRSSLGFQAVHWGQNGDIPVSMFPNQ